jgi:enterochelin esterase-like enzyme
MRWLPLILIACSSSGSSAPAPAPAPMPPAANAPPKVPAEKLENGRPVERAIKVGEKHRYRVELAAGNVAIGTVVQNGIDVLVMTFDATGKQVAEFDSPNGPAGPEPFALEATVAGAYDFEVRPFSLPPGSTEPAIPTEGRYEARVDDILTADGYAERRAKERIDSARILDAWRAVRTRKQAEVDKFWAELAGKAPIVEPYPGEPKDALVTFVYRSKLPYVALIGGPDFREKPLVRIGDSDLLYLTARVPADSRFDYAFIPAEGPPDFHVPYRKEQGLDPRFARRQPDPNNPRQHNGFSRAELPGAAPQPWIATRPDVSRGKVTERKIESAKLKESRRVGIYTPANHDPKRRYPLVIVFDGETYGLEGDPQIALPTILDNLIAANKIPPVVAVLVASGMTRNRDLPGSEAFSAFLADELVPRMRADYRAGMTAAETIVTGSSFGGLCAAFSAFHHPDVIGNVLSNSGSYQYVRGAIENDISSHVEGGWLIRDYAKAPKKPIRFYLDAGLFEMSLLDSNRHLRDVLVAKGYPVVYAEFSGGHDYWMWRGTISDGLIALLYGR